MAKWSDVIRLVAEQKTKEATILLNEMAKLKLVDDRPTKTALTKIVKITLDLTTTGKTGTATEYFELREVQPAVSEFMKDLDPVQVIQKVVRTLGGNGFGGASGATETAAAPKDEPTETKDEGEVEGYFPGVETEGAPMITGQDATRFLKSNGKPPAVAPPAETKPPETAPKTASTPPTEPAKAPETPPEASRVSSFSGPAQESRKDSKGALIAGGLRMIAQGLASIADAFEQTDDIAIASTTGPVASVESTLDKSDTAGDSDEFFVAADDDDGF